MYEYNKDNSAFIKGLINSSDVFLFVKGDEESSHCFFSREAINILQELNISFKTYNVLSVRGMREEVKKISQWPTFPQIYYKGELVGGYDILKELYNSGTLKGRLSVK